MSKKEHKQSKMRSLFKGLRKSTTDLSEWSKNDEKLMKAVEAGDLTKIEHTLNKKTLNPTKLGPKGLSVFHVACSLGQLAVVEMLISHGSEVNVLSIQGNTSVQLAARDGWPQVLKRLIDAGGVIDHKDGLSMTALHHACLRSQVPCAQVLLQHGADPNSRDKTGKPPLFYGAYSGDIGVCKELLDKGANVNCHDEQQLTPLMAAAKKGNGPCCEFLLKKGADPNFCDVQGHDALSYALDAGHTHLQEVFSKAPTRASWDVVQDDTAVTQGGQVAPDEPVQEAVIEGDTDDVAEGVDKDNMVAKFVPESTPEILRKSEQTGQTENPEVIQILTEKRAKGDLDEATLAERAASPPQSVIDQRTLEAYKELEEENDHLNEDYQALTAQHRRLQDEYSTLKKQLSTPAPPATDPEEVQELERELSDLKSVLTEETDKNMKLVKRLKDVKRKYKPQGSPESAEDSWSDSDDELFEESSTLKRKSAVVDHKPQTLLLLQNQVAQLRQDNKQLRERMQRNGTSITNSLFGRREMTGSVSSLGSIEDGHGGSQNSQEVDRLKRKVEELEVDKQTLQKQIHENNVFPEDQQENMMVLEQENTQLHSEVKQLRTEVNLLKLSKDSSKDITLLNGDVREGHSDKVNNGETSESAITVEKYENVESSPSEELEQERKAIIKVNEALRTENQLLTEELETLRVTYNKLVIAGDNLQDMYDQMVLEKEQILEDLEKTSTSKQEIAKENEFLLADGNAMHDDIERLVQEVEQLQGQKQTISEENDSLKRQLSAVNVAGKASDLARIVEERDKLQERVGELEDLSEELKQNHDIVLEEVQSLQDALQRIEYERDQIQQEFDSLQDEFENIQGSHEGLQQDYTQLEQDFSDLLADKEKLEQDFMDVQTANVNVEHNNPELLEERDKFQQENTVLVMEKEQLDMTVNELSKSNALIQEELASLKKALKLNEIKGDKPGNTSDDSETSTLPSQKEKRDKTAVDTVVEKDRRIRSLQIQISRLQQQLAESDRHYRDVISTYRTHLLSAVQGHMDPDVKQALYNIIELRSTEQFC